VPESYEPDDPENVQILKETGEIGIPIYPDSYTKDVAEKFLNKIDSGEWQAAALEFDIPEAYARLHQDKVDVELRNMIIAKGKGTARDEWFNVPIEFEASFCFCCLLGSGHGKFLIWERKMPSRPHEKDL
jgi:hypothetical protein